VSDLQARLAEHLWTEHRWDRTADWDGLLRSRDLIQWHGLEHETGAGQQWAGWREHGHTPELEATAR
jgi:hypothetical protein